MRISSKVVDKNDATVGNSNIINGIDRQCTKQIDDKIMASLERIDSPSCSLNIFVFMNEIKASGFAVRAEPVKSNFLLFDYKPFFALYSY